MALNTNTYGYVIDPLFSFCDQGGKTIANGYVRVFRAGTSTPVLTYRNFDGAFNAETIELDNSGRTMTKVIASKGDLYKVCVYDAEHSQEDPVLTVDKVAVIGASVNATNIVQGMNDVAGSGWIKSVSADDTAEVSLDATNVTSEVDTMVKATAASADYMMPLVHKAGSDPDKKITLGNIFKFVLNCIHSLTDTATESDIASGNYFALDGSAGTKKLNSTTLLTKTAQNALAGNVAPAFVPNETNAVAGMPYVYGGTLYVAKEAYQGPWNANKFVSLDIGYIIRTSGVVERLNGGVMLEQGSYFYGIKSDNSKRVRLSVPLIPPFSISVKSGYKIQASQKLTNNDVFVESTVVGAATYAKTTNDGYKYTITIAKSDDTQDILPTENIINSFVYINFAEIATSLKAIQKEHNSGVYERLNGGLPLELGTYSIGVKADNSTRARYNLPLLPPFSIETNSGYRIHTISRIDKDDNYIDFVNVDYST
jgi:hypothetical protein